SPPWSAFHWSSYPNETASHAKAPRSASNQTSSSAPRRSGSQKVSACCIQHHCRIPAKPDEFGPETILNPCLYRTSRSAHSAYYNGSSLPETAVSSAVPDKLL